MFGDANKRYIFSVKTRCLEYMPSICNNKYLIFIVNAQ